MNKAYKNLLFLGMAAMLVFAPVARGAVSIWSLTPILLIEAILIFAWMWRLNNASGKIAGSEHRGVDGLIAMLFAFAFLSFVFSKYKHPSFYALLELAGYIGIYYLVINEFDRNMIKRLVALVIFMGTALSAYGLLQYFGLLGRSWWYPQGFLSATYVNHNHFAGYLELVIPLALAAGLIRRAQRSMMRRLWLSVSIVVMAAAFILTQSRGAWLALSISLFVMAAVAAKSLSRDKKGILILVLVAALAASLIYFGRDVISQRIEGTTNAEGREASFETRLKIWRGTLEMIKENPITGMGIGTFIWEFPRFRPEGLNVQANFAHNDYLEIAAEMGIPAALIIISLFIMVVVTGLKKGESDPYAFGCAIGVLSLSLHGLVDFNFHIPANMLLVTVYAAIIMARPAMDAESRT